MAASAAQKASAVTSGTGWDAAAGSVALTSPPGGWNATVQQPSSKTISSSAGWGDQSWNATSASKQV